MIRHMLKQLWNRRRSNLLIVLEIMGSFFALVVIATIGVYYYVNFSEPLGFDYRNVWCIRTDIVDRTREWTESDTKILNQLYNALRDLPEIQAIGASRPYPYTIGEWTNLFEYGGNSVYAWGCNTALDLNNVFNINISKGRWFDSGDEAAGMNIVVVNRIFAERLFGSTDPVGKIFFERSPLAKRGNEKKYMIVGVIDYFKLKGELWGNNPVIMVKGENLNFSKLVRGDETKVFQNFLIRVSPGATAELEEKIVENFRRIAGDLTVKIERLEDLRASYFKSNLIPLFAGALVAIFLLFMVSLGLVGVLWMNVSKRVQEIGLRRAKGATKSNIYRQITGEILCLTSIGLLLGFAIAIQFPLFNFIDFVAMKVYIAAMLISALIIYIISAVSGFYPSYLAARIHPAEALHTE